MGEKVVEEAVGAAGLKIRGRTTDILSWFIRDFMLFGYSCCLFCEDNLKTKRSDCLHNLHTFGLVLPMQSL